jgi:hypothetical protein
MKLKITTDSEAVNLKRWIKDLKGVTWRCGEEETKTFNNEGFPQVLEGNEGAFRLEPE